MAFDGLWKREDEKGTEEEKLWRWRRLDEDSMVVVVLGRAREVAKPLEDAIQAMNSRE